MAVSLSIFLIFYGVFLLVWLIFSLVAYYHMFRYGFKSLTTYFSSFIYLAVSLSILAATYYYGSEIDWNFKVIIFKELLNPQLPY
jgi:hypothetical protein